MTKKQRKTERRDHIRTGKKKGKGKRRKKEKLERTEEKHGDSFFV